MSRVRRPLIRRKSTVVISGALAMAVLVTATIFATGYDAQVVPRLESSVWVVRDSGQYARVNTDLGEIDTVRTVDDPTGIVQSGPNSIVFTQANHGLWPVDAASPGNLTAAAESDQTTTQTATARPAAKTTPLGTRSVVASGNHVAYLTDTGKIFLSAIDDKSGAMRPIAPKPEGKFPSYAASAIAVSDTGDVYSYSADDRKVRRWDGTTGAFDGQPVTLTDPPAKSAKPQLSAIAGHWVLSDPASRRVWFDGHPSPISTTLSPDARLQTSSPTGNRFYLADSKKLVSLDFSSGIVRTEAVGTGVPTEPTMVDGSIYQAWLAPTSGSFWNSDTGKSIPLTVEGDALDKVQSIVPVMASNGQRAVLSERSSGLLWTVPDGKPIPIGEWSLDDVRQEAGTNAVDDLAEEKPPVAVPDLFGVRPGQLVELPLLLNDYDPNRKDVLTIDPTSLAQGLSDPAFGSLSLVGNDQDAVIQVHARSGTATFSYTVTDGVMTSAPATVTLSIVGAEENSAPQWCGVQSCVQRWPAPQIAPGGTISVPVLTGWMDPEGDPFILADARKMNPADPVTVVPLPNGSVAIRHLDPNAAEQTIPILITVSDSRGAIQTKTLELTVTATPGLTAAPVAVLAGIGQKKTVVIADHVFGGSGSYRLLDASTSPGAGGVVVVPNSAAGTIDVTPAATGNYLVNYTVQDVQTRAELSGVVRFTVVAGVNALALAPLTAFVRAREDTTIAVLDAVQNTTGRVLAVSAAVSNNPKLSVSVVGLAAVRVSGSTDNDLPGTVGTVNITVSDGEGASVTGTLTVFLVAASTGIGPIAMPDTATVRAGAQSDLPVLSNDVSPRGERLVLYPTVDGSSSPGELSFVSGNVIRYLAPQTPGFYSLHYSVYLESEPNRLDSTTVNITVIPATSTSNRPPQPRILSARVPSGQSVSIPVDGYGMDPDGDAVVLANVSQPKAGHGSVTISADGRTLDYVAPTDVGSDGQVVFTYTIHDSGGLSATGDVRVAVIGGRGADTAPVTYSDYVRAQQNAATPLTLMPLVNDSDPAGGTLTITSLVPYAPRDVGNPEFDRLAALIDPSTDLAKGIVALRPGALLGTQSYLYTAKSSVTSSTSQGLIVVTIAAGPVPELPQIADSVLTAKNRTQLSSGIDVVTGKVHWPTGDVSKLSLRLWGDSAAKFSVAGRSIVGNAPDSGDLVPFALSGTDQAGKKVVSYGFLRIPAFDDMRVQLAPGIAAAQVEEDKSVDIALGDMLDLDRNQLFEIRADDSFTVQRSTARCTPGSRGHAMYGAGREAPWSDYCTVPVRLAGQHEWTMLPVPIAIQPQLAAPQLGTVSRTVAPGDSATVDLYQSMTTWQGGRVGDKAQLDYAAVYSGSNFTVRQLGSVISIEARVAATPGTKETIAISVSHFGGLTGSIILTVGAAPIDAPRGATFTQQCDVSTAADCTIALVGRAGEYDPFAGKAGAGLTVVGIGASVCPAAEISLDDAGRLSVDWPSGKSVGGECLVPYTVKDAQNRFGSGLVTVDLLGYPPTPASIRTTGYTAAGVTVSVELGDGGLAHPSVASVDLSEDGQPVQASCLMAGQSAFSCTVKNLTNGVKHAYSARATNSVGSSADSTVLSTWAYRVPVISTLTANPIYVAATTSPTVAVVHIAITAGDDAHTFTIGNTAQKIPRTGTVTEVDITVPPGSQVISVVPSSQFSPPIGTSGSDGGAATKTVLASGAPLFSSPVKSSPTKNSNTSITVTDPKLSMNSSARPSSIKYVVWRTGSPDATCVAALDGTMVVTGGVQSSTSPISGLDPYQDYSVIVCATNGFGVVKTDPSTVFTYTSIDDPRNDYTFSVSTAPDTSGHPTYRYTASGPVIDQRQSLDVFFLINGVKTSVFAISDDVISDVSVEYCTTSRPDTCSNPTAVTPKGAPTTATVNFPAGCVAVTSTGADVTISKAAASSGVVTMVPVYDRNRQGTATYTVDWTGPFASLEPSVYATPIC